MNKYKCKVIITDTETGEEVIYNLDDFNSSLSNDLDTVPTHVGDFLAAPMYSRGYHVNISGYMKNPNIDKEYKEAIEEAHNRVSNGVTDE